MLAQLLWLTFRQLSIGKMPFFFNNFWLILLCKYIKQNKKMFGQNTDPSGMYRALLSVQFMISKQILKYFPLSELWRKMTGEGAKMWQKPDDQNIYRNMAETGSL